MEYSHLPDKELLSILEDATFAVKLEDSPEWKVFREVCQRIEKKASEELLNTSVDEKIKIIELQVAIKFYRKVLPNLIASIKAEGEEAFIEAQERGLLSQTT